MKKILLAAGLAALMSAPAFAAPEPFNVEVGPQGQMRASPPGSQCCQGQASWSQATAPGQQGGASMMQASDEGQQQKKKPRRAKKPPQQPAE